MTFVVVVAVRSPKFTLYIGCFVGSAGKARFWSSFTERHWQAWQSGTAAEGREDKTSGEH